MIDMSDIWTDMSCWWYDRWTSCHQIHLNHVCDVTPHLSTQVVVVEQAKKVLGLHMYWDYLAR